MPAQRRENAPEQAGEAGLDDEPELPTMQKVAVLFIAMGEDVSGEVMKHLSDYEIEEVTQAIAGLKNVPTGLIDKVLGDFEQHLPAGEWISQGGIDFARSALERAIGPRKAQEILDRVATMENITPVSSRAMLHTAPPSHDST